MRSRNTPHSLSGLALKLYLAAQLILENTMPFPFIRRSLVAGLALALTMLAALLSMAAPVVAQMPELRIWPLTRTEISSKISKCSPTGAF